MRRDARCFLSAGRRTRSAGADRVGAAASADQLNGDHARGRGSRHCGYLGVRLVVPVVQCARRPQPGAGYEGRIEFVVWSIPALIVTLLGGVIWIGSHQLDPRAPISANADPLRVDVVALDWKWLFIYPDQRIAAVNQLVVPAGTPVEFRLTSATVMNSFFVPQLGSQIYTMGGMTTHLNLLAKEPGEFPGFSANFSGDGFSEMRFIAKAVPPGDFGAWVAQVQGTGTALDDAGYAELAKPSKAVPATTYGTVAPLLFERIVHQTASGFDKAGVGAAWCSPVPQGGG
jgi:cytochrome o ubiquinol oxidase subunit II